MSSKQKALERQAQIEAEKERKKKEEEERKAAAEWSVGTKDNSKSKVLEDKEAERIRKANEKAALLAAEEAELSSVKRVTKTKKKGKDDFDLLNQALANQPKSKAQKEAEAKKKADEEKRLREEEEARERKAARLKAQEEERRKAAAKGIVLNHTDDLFIPINNTLEEDDIIASGLDGAVDALSGALGKSKIDNRGKNAYKAFVEARLVTIREEFPGLKLSQYQERIFEEWKTSPENPKNQIV